ncbi:regulator of telomere elongation helicase 1 homolog isoform X2 [Anoplophora glabripennis]|uniref:regulator of telomere elongation helicase 1 homolog isoform X2 n=1 Tax=Anoplophora glabripennis TaxID=217634 RepID=UPI000874E32D|nr:regulator of telomere elongation helicase 1 homolog isoform X2 [Anoplophora glabripennis]
MCTVTIKGVPIKFPFEPYDLQKKYMEKVVECLQNECNGVLESPTGTGKTLSLLCSSLAWLELKKAQLQAQRQIANFNEDNEYLNSLDVMLQKTTGKRSGRSFLGLPTIIYASRTHSQLTQAMQELKKTSYKYMKAYVLASREQMCIHPELMSESSNDLKRQMCDIKVKSRSCHYYNRVEQKKNDPELSKLSIIDIEDMIKLGNCHKFCPYFMAKELKQDADIIFMPYNYLLDPISRKAIDEAHNIERTCEESASLQLKTSDIALAIEEVTAVMKMLSSETVDFNDSPKDFAAEDLCVLKQMLLDFEKEMDSINLKGNSSEGTNFDGDFIFELLSKAGIHENNCRAIITLLSNISQFLNVIASGPFARRGIGLLSFERFLTIVFIGTTEEFKQKVKRCYKVHVIEEQPKKKKPDNWLAKATVKAGGRILSYWCFSPGFGMNMFMDKGLKCVILTSGTLAPLRPLISELAINIPVCLENPHIVKNNQVCVKIVSTGPDQEILNCNYQNRGNIKYIASVGRSILNLARIIPDGLLIFFPSYPIMQKFQQYWQESGLWTNISQQKMIYVEPKDKTAFNSTMEEYYMKIKDVSAKGAIFMGVCRGKVSEGLDFADANGRAVIVIGLPYPPLMDPKIVLKKQYLDLCHTADKEYLRGDEWYSLEATRTVNQAIGRVIRHRNDYGAIILLDARFNNFKIKNQISRWLRDNIKVINNFGEIMRDLKAFFKIAELNFPVCEPKSSPLASVAEAVPNISKQSNFDFSTSSVAGSSISNSGEVVIHKRSTKEDLFNPMKRKKINLIPNTSNVENTGPQEYMTMVRKALDPASLTNFICALKMYGDTLNFSKFINLIDEIFRTKHQLKYLILGLDPYIKNCHKDDYNKYCEHLKQYL